MEKILIAFDYSKHLDKILNYLGRFIKNRSDVELYFVNIKQPTCILPEMFSDTEDKDLLFQRIESLKKDKKKLNEAQKKIENELSSKINSALASIGIKTDQFSVAFIEESGDFSQIILDRAKKYDCKTIVLGKKGDSIISEYLIGSTTEKLSRISKGFTIWIID